MGSRRSVPLAAAALAALLAGCSGAMPVAQTKSPPTTAITGTTLVLEDSPHGPILADGHGDTLYDFTPDTPTMSACVTAACVYEWPPLIIDGRPTVGKGLKASLVTTFVRTDGRTQVAYGGHPLYLWYNDTKPGMVTGQDLYNQGGYWYVIDAAGRQITAPFSVPG